MMDREWSAILNRFGQTVGVDGREVKAFLQPVLEKGEGQVRPSPLGLRREDRLLYLGPADVPLQAGVSRVEANGRDYVVQSAHPVGTAVPHHWWAVLRPRDEVRV